MENTLSLSELKDFILNKFQFQPDYINNDWDYYDEDNDSILFDENELSSQEEFDTFFGTLKQTMGTKNYLKFRLDNGKFLEVKKYNDGGIEIRLVKKTDTPFDDTIYESITKNKMKTTTLRELIRESIQGYIREIDMVSEVAAIESKIAEAKKAIEERKSKLTKADELNESGLIDEKIVKKIQKEVALLEKYASKQEALLEKKKAKMKGKSKEVDDDMITEEPMEEIDGLEEMGYMEEESSMEEGKEEEMKEKAEKNDKEYNPMNESFLRMQKLAGLITETQYRKKIQILNEGVKLDTLMKDGKPNTEILVVPDQFYKNEDELRAHAMRPYEIKKEEGREDKMLFNIVGSQGGKHQASIKGDEVKDVILFDDAKKKLL